MAILLLLFKRAVIAPNKFIDTQYYKRHKETEQRENSIYLTFHPHNHAVKSIILKTSKLLQNDPDTGRIFSQPSLISYKTRQKHRLLFSQKCIYSKQVNNPVLLNALVHDAKHVLSLATLRKYRHPSDQSRSLIISPVPQPMSSNV